jgi:tetratricopeptide (TPR) repeat protein
LNEAERALDEALDRVPINSGLLNERGFLLYDLGQYDKAQEAFARTLAIDPTNETALKFRIASLQARNCGHFCSLEWGQSRSRKRLA